MNGNARISKTFLGYEDNGMLTCWIHLIQPGKGQAFGGFRLDGPKTKDTKYCGFFIRRILEVVGVEQWEQIPGQAVRVIGTPGNIEAIGNLLEERWFNPSKELKEENL